MGLAIVPCLIFRDEWPPDHRVATYGQPRPISEDVSSFLLPRCPTPGHAGAKKCPPLPRITEHPAAIDVISRFDHSRKEGQPPQAVPEPVPYDLQISFG